MVTQIKVPTLGESVSEATVAKWLKQVGDAVRVDEPVVELETDKVTLEVPAPAAGRLSEILAQAGETVGVEGVLGMIDQAGAAAAVTPSAKSALPPVAAASPSLPPALTLAPSVQKLVTEHRLDPVAIAGTGKDGRLTKGDVLSHLSAPPSADGREERVRMTRLRKRIAERLKQAQNTAAMLTTFNEVDMTEAMQARSRFNEHFEKKHGVKLGFMSLFVKACISALKDIPAVNAEIDGEEIVYKNYYDIGVAVGTEQGLVVPVVRNADAMGFADIEKKIAELGKRARDGKLSLDELSGGTFTISNGGIYGSLLSTPILNPPQSGILGMHKIQKRPVAIADKSGERIEIRPMMYLALSYDHRLIDGREAVTFLIKVKEAIETPQRLLFDL